MTFRLLAPLAALFVLAAPAVAQNFGQIEDRQTNVPAYFFHVLPGEATMRVYVWGTVAAPGVYEIAQNRDLAEVLALAGGPRADAIRGNSRIETTIRLYRMEGATRTLVYERLVEEMVGEPGSYPPLNEGDVIQIETREFPPFTWRDAITIAGGVAVSLLAIERMIALAGGGE